MLVDPFQRRIHYLRLSVTDRCNIRCHYCMPFDPASLRSLLPGAGNSDMLTFEEIARLVEILAGLGIRKVRLTGGEPLIRHGLESLVGRLRSIAGLDELSLTTNGILLKRLAGPLRDAGLDRINIHLDTLSPERFSRITRLGDVGAVLKGIEAARTAGFTRLKLNAVLQRGINDGDVEDLLRFAADGRMILRLIEMMPLGPGRDLTPSLFISGGEVRERLARRWTLTPSQVTLGSGPAVYYHVKELDTEVGFITPISQPFCDRCNRVRITSDGRFQDCLAYDGRLSLRDLLRNPQLTDVQMEREIERMLYGKRKSHDGFSQSAAVATPCMNGIGG